MQPRYDLSPDQYASAFAAFEAAVARAPGQVAFANICRCSQGNVSQLLRKKSLLPERYVIKVEAGTGISRTALRPDIYPDDASDLAVSTSAAECERTHVLQDRAA